MRILLTTLVPIFGCDAAGSTHDATLPDANNPDARPPGTSDAALPDATRQPADAMVAPDAPPGIVIDLPSFTSPDGCARTIELVQEEATIVDTAYATGIAVRGGTGDMFMDATGAGMLGAPDERFIDSHDRLEVTFDPPARSVTYALESGVDRDADGVIAHRTSVNLRFPAPFTGTDPITLEPPSPNTMIGRIEIYGGAYDGIRIMAITWSICAPTAK